MAAPFAADFRKGSLIEGRNDNEKFIFSSLKIERVTNTNVAAAAAAKSPANTVIRSNETQVTSKHTTS